jgi:hypothetical protein
LMQRLGLSSFFERKKKQGFDDKVSNIYVYVSKLGVYNGQVWIDYTGLCI